MVINPMKALLFAGGAAAAVAAIAWAAVSLDPHLQGKPPVMAAVPNPLPSAIEQAAEPKGPQNPAEPSAEVIPPSFDLVRAEPNGSLVVAGRAAPDALVEIIAGSEVVGSTRAGPEGDFAAVLDNPLKPGDHRIVLRATKADNLAAASPETAIVSIPEQPDGQVLALVERPGEPSRLITVPESALAEAADAAAEPEPAVVDMAALAPDASAPAGEQLAPETAQAESETDAAAPATEAVAEQPAEPQTAPAEMAAVAPHAATAPATPAEPQPIGEPRVAVEAVEIDGERVFVAGIAEPGKVVRVYANDILLGEATASSAGRFLVETVRDLPVGDYLVRADLLDPNGADVLARAAVPFEREAGEAIAAVAPVIAPEIETAPAPLQESAPAGVSNGVHVAEAAPEQEPEPAAPLVADAEPQVAAEPAQASAGDQPASEVAGSATVEQQIAAAPQSDAAVPDSGAGAAAQVADAPAAAPDAASEAAATAPLVAETAPAAGVNAPNAAAEAPEQQIAAASPNTPPTVTAPKLESVPSAVIIRRGDNLWRISSRVYGHGMRYTTIYLANQSQIRNPDLIFPGQVFAVPKQTEEGVPADMEAIKERFAGRNRNSATR